MLDNYEMVINKETNDNKIIGLMRYGGHGFNKNI
jgi:hypothetical protein